MAQSKLIDAHVSLKQCKLAIDALHSHSQNKEKEHQEKELLPGKEQHVWLSVGVKKMYPEKKLKPFRIPIAHPLVDPRTSAICLITKDPQREYKDLLESHGIKFISRVVGVTKLKGKFKPFEARRLLLQENAMFLADDRVIPLLPGLLGRKWFDAKKQPIPVCLTLKDLKGELERAISSTYMHQNRGTCTSIKVGTLSQTPTQILANIKTALPEIVKHIKGGWDDIQSMNIKTNSSVSLPIWTCDLGETETGRWGGLIAEADNEMSSREEEAEGAVVSNEAKSVRGKSGQDKNGKKRASGSDGVERPKKKLKSPEGLLSPQVAIADSTPAGKPIINSHSHPNLADPPLTKKRARSSDTDTDHVTSLSTPSNPAETDDAKNRPAVALTRDQLKQKRNVEGVARKKEKVAGVKSGKSAKNSLLGKKAIES